MTLMHSSSNAPLPQFASDVFRIMKAGTDVERCLAVQVARQLAPEAALPHLLQARLDEDEDVRVDAIDAIARLSGREVEEALLHSLVNDPNIDVKAVAIRGLGALRSRLALDVLCAMAVEQTETVAWDEADLALADWDEWLDLQRASIEALGRIRDARAIDPIVEAMNDEFGQDLWDEGISALLAIGGAATDIVLDVLHHANERVRRRALGQLVKSPGALTHDHFEVLATDRSAEVRQLVARHIDLDNDTVVQTLCGDDNAFVRAVAISRTISGEREQFLRVLDDCSPHVVGSAIGAFAKTTRRRCCRAVEDRLLDLAKLDAAKQGDEAVLIAVIDAAPVLLPHRERELVRALAARRSPPAEARRRATHRLSINPDRATLSLLVTLVADPVRLVRLAAIDALATIASQDSSDARARAKATEVLLAAFSGKLIAAPNAEPVAAAKSDGTASFQRSVRPGREAATDDDAARDVRVQIDEHGNVDEIAQEATRIGTGDQGGTENSAGGAASDNAGEGEVPLAQRHPMSTLDAIRGLNLPADEEPDTAAVDLSADDMELLELATGRVGRKAHTLESGIAAHHDVRLLSSKVLSCVEEPCVLDALVPTLASNNVDIRTAAATSLAILVPKLAGHAQTLQPFLEQRAKDANVLVRLSMIRCLGYLGPSARSCLISALEDHDPAVRAEAIGALSQCDAHFDAKSLVSSEHSIVRKAAARSVAASCIPTAFETVTRFALDHDGEDAREGFSLLRRINPGKLDALICELLDERGQSKNRQICLGAL